MGGKYVDREKAFFLHPNVQTAYLEYDGDAAKFAKTMRELKQRDGHQVDHDEEMAETAERLTMQAIMGGFKPFPKGKK